MARKLNTVMSFLWIGTGVKACPYGDTPKWSSKTDPGSFSNGTPSLSEGMRRASPCLKAPELF